MRIRKEYSDRTVLKSWSRITSGQNFIMELKSGPFLTDEATSRDKTVATMSHVSQWRSTKHVITEGCCFHRVRVTRTTARRDIDQVQAAGTMRICQLATYAPGSSRPFAQPPKPPRPRECRDAAPFNSAVLVQWALYS